MPTERFDVELTLRAQSQGQAAFAQTEAGLKVVRDAVRRFAEAQNNGIGSAEAYKVAISEFKNEALQAGLSFEGEAQAVRDVSRAIDRFREIQAAGLILDQATAADQVEQASVLVMRTRETDNATAAQSANVAAAQAAVAAAVENTIAQTGESVSSGALSAAAFEAAVAVAASGVAKEGTTVAAAEDTAATDAETQANAALIPALWGTVTATAALTGAILGAIPAWIMLIVWISAATVALLPFIVGLLDAAVAMAGFVVAGAGALVLAAGLAVSFAAVGVVLGLVGSQTATWARTIADLKSKFQPLITTLDKLVRPLIIEISKFIQAMIPGITQVATALTKWFGNELPGVLKGISGVIKDLTPTFKEFGKFLSQTFDEAGPTIKTFFEIMMKGGIQAIEGLVSNLLRLTNWFNSESPKWTPIWAAIGSVIQWVADEWGKLNDWIVANFPQTLAQVQKFVDKLQAGWDKWGPTFITLAGLIGQFVQVGLQEFIDHADVLVPLLLGAALAFLAVFAAVAILVGALAGATSAILDFLTNTDGQFVTWANHIIDAINEVIDGLDKIPGVNITPVPYVGYPSGFSGNSQSSQNISKNRSGGNQSFNQNDNAADGGTGASGKTNAGKANSSPSSGSGKRPTGNEQFRAGGGEIRKDQPYFVGEDGMELVIPDMPGTVIPHNVLFPPEPSPTKTTDPTASPSIEVFLNPSSVQPPLPGLAPLPGAPGAAGGSGEPSTAISTSGAAGDGGVAHAKGGWASALGGIGMAFSDSNSSSISTQARPVTGGTAHATGGKGGTSSSSSVGGAGGSGGIGGSGFSSFKVIPSAVSPDDANVVGPSLEQFFADSQSASTFSNAISSNTASTTVSDSRSSTVNDSQSSVSESLMLDSYEIRRDIQSGFGDLNQSISKLADSLKTPAGSQSTSSSDQIAEILQSIEDHLQAIRTSAPGITAASSTRRNG